MQEISTALGLNANITTILGDHYKSCFAVSDLAAASIGAVGQAVAALVDGLNLSAHRPSIEVDHRLASLWFAQSIYPIDWKMPPSWDAIAGDYKARNGWIRLHTNLPRHRAAALSVLQVPEDRARVAAAVLEWDADDLEDAILCAGGVAAVMQSEQQWSVHPQGIAVAAEPLIAFEASRQGNLRDWMPSRKRPLEGLRVLDLTRVLAGPVATRTLAGFGADVLRIDPPNWDEGVVVPDITLGKRCSYLDLTQPTDHKIFIDLLASADMLVHGYRPGALDGLGLGADARRKIAPNLIEISLNAYGWSGPWAMRRGFDSLVQMSCGIADTGRQWANKNAPTPQPVQALDHATGYLMAAAAITLLQRAALGEGIQSAKLSLARTAALLMQYPQSREGNLSKHPQPSDFTTLVETTPWGAAHRLNPPLNITGTPMTWARPANKFGSAAPKWL